MSTLFFVVNQDPFDGSAHGLYCLRNCRALADAAPENTVRLVYPGALLGVPLRASPRDQTVSDDLNRMGLSSPPNLRLHPLPALRRARGRRGVTVNAVYYWACLLFLRRRMRPGDTLASASFAGLTRFLFRRPELERNVRRVYEVHQLTHLEQGPESKAARVEQAVFSDADVLLTTTEVLRDQLQKLVPGKPVTSLGLACGFDPETVPPPEPDASRPFTLAYIGSLYPEQGVQWLMGAWSEIMERVHAPLRLKIAGGSPREVEALRGQTVGREETVQVHGPVAPGKLPRFLQDVDALIIPALNRGRMPYVAITKAYDYPGLNRPILAANLPSIAEVLRPGREAVLFAPEDAAGVADALARIVRDADLVRTLTANCRARREEFTWENRSTAWWQAARP
ncbi:glycosyltransferase family 4 protein [Desulfonatronum lacustre]|uniref:glycosyltransferase family 4 protein n=1 Tax=Desulfonatronum lacustre TaxID=66849 RepID=UPI00048B88BF|nr:glycosyltransferase family 4 protein [Desulfonatronum lacustre]SMP49308.1 Glycosyl transferases group 1 [Desulfonatronum zhilinae]